MFPRRRPLLTAFLLLSSFGVVSLRLAALDDNKAADPNLASADQLFRAGKFADAESAYSAIVQKDSHLVPAQVGLARSMLKQQKLDESLDATTKALAITPNSATLLAALGEIQFRRGEMFASETSYLKAKAIDPKEVRIYLGLSRLYSSYSLYRKAYDLLETAHNLAPTDIEVQRAWLRMLPRKERLVALEAYLAEPHPDDPEDTQSLQEYLLEGKHRQANSPLQTCQQGRANRDQLGDDVRC